MAKKENTTNPFTNEEVEETQVMAVSHGDIASVDLIDQLKNPDSAFFCSIVDDGSRKSKVAIYNAVNSQDEHISDHIGEVINAVDVVAHSVTLTDPETGEITTALRTVIVDDKGVKYDAVSSGITSSLQKIFAIIGMPTWADEPVKMRFKQVKTSNGMNKVNTIELVD